MAGVALILAALGASAGVALKSLSDPWQAAPSAASASDATASERVLAHAVAAPRIEKRVDGEAADVPAGESSPVVSSGGAVSTAAAPEATRVALRSARPSPAGAAQHPRAGQSPHGGTPRVGHIAPRPRGAHPTSSGPGARRAKVEKVKPAKPH
jgi:hypothetical protein